MPDSPIRAFLTAIDAFDVEAAASQFADRATLTMAFGQRAEGHEQLREALRSFVSELRATRHDVTAEWNPEADVWIAELTALYELRDFNQLGPFRRAIVVHSGPTGIVDMSIYGAHELPLSQAERPYQEVYAAGHWMPTL
jgi:hypothetical protein